MTIMEGIDRVRDYLDSDDWRYEYEDDKRLIRAGVALKSKLQSLKLYLIFNDNGYTVQGVCPMKADDNVRAAVMEYLTRANYGLRNGNFELDLRDGEVRYKTYVNYKGMDVLSDGVISDSLIIPALMFDRYGDGMAAIMFGFSDPETEINKVEKK